jgi:HlyD family type I secretion membrane fusion protein
MAQSLSLASPRAVDAARDAIGAFESETTAVIAATRPRRDHVVIYVVCAFIVSAIAFMAIAKVERVVTGDGLVISSRGSLFVQPLSRAIIREIRVKAGDVVAKDQVLATLDPTFASADLTSLEQKMGSVAAEVGRLEAEQAARDFAPAERDPNTILQLAFWQQRQGEYQASIRDFDARIAAAQSQVDLLKQDAAMYQQRRDFASRIEGMQTALENAGAGSKLNAIIASDSRVEIERQLSDSLNQIGQNEHNLDSLREQRAAYIDKWRNQIASDLVAARKSYDETAQDLAKAKKLHDLVDLTAPADAVVLRVSSIASVGSTTSDTDPLITLVPLDGPVEAEIAVDSRDVGFVRVGDPVEVKLDAYDFLWHGTAKGKITTISEGSFTIGEKQETRPPYFKARVAFTEVKLRNVPQGFRIIPGMTLVGDVMVGRRTILSYVIEGGLRTGAEAMREP